jgi:DNA-binding winged helix-turn-helix (wHTH) protein/TolB-like protein
VGDRFRFGEFEFDAGSQELRRTDGSDVQRLAPQPAQLLHLLAARGGGIVSRDEIRQRLWPDTHVDFDASLHFCVRQVRAALHDSASEPRYIQNVPRRGYRLVPPVTGADGPAAAAAVAKTRPATAVALLVLVLAAGAALYYWTRGVDEQSPVRIAIMPFEPPIGERILEELAAIAGDAVALVGPTTTSSYSGSDSDLRRLAADYRIDYVVNARPLGSGGRPPVLAELIRVSDGAHVWVRSYDDLADARRIGAEVGRQVAQALKLAP